MRRKEKEITDINEKLNVIKTCKVCRIGLSENNNPYIIPLNYGYTFDNDVLTLFFHSALEGKKLDIIKNNNNACFEIDFDTKLIEAEKACDYGYAFKSIIGFGKIMILENLEEKASGLNKIMKHQTEKETVYDFSPSELKRVCVYKMIVKLFTGKQKDLFRQLTYFILPFFFFFYACTTSSVKGFHFQTGDLVFQVEKSSELNDAIAEVTFGESNIHYTHVGIVSVENDTVFVIEAIPPKVCKTLLDTFLLRSANLTEKPIVSVGRLKQKYRESIPQAIATAKNLLGKPYDYIYSPDNDAYYCSELVTHSYLNNNDKPIFEPVRMNFRDANGNLPTYWIEHFKKYHAVIPENCMGSNPSDLSKSNKIEIVYRYFE